MFQTSSEAVDITGLMLSGATSIPLVTVTVFLGDKRLSVCQLMPRGMLGITGTRCNLIERILQQTLDTSVDILDMCAPFVKQTRRE